MNRMMALLIMLLLSAEVFAQKHHAIIIGAQPESAPVNQFSETIWPDMFKVYHALRVNGYQDSRIHVLFNSGNDLPGLPLVFQAATYGYQNIQGQPSITDFSCNNQDIHQIFDWVSPGGAINPDVEKIYPEDYVTIYVTGHAVQGGGVNSSLVLNNDMIADDELASLFDALDCKKMIVFQNDYSSYFSLLITDPNTVWSAASGFNPSERADDANPDGLDQTENYSSGSIQVYTAEYAYHFVNAILGKTFPGGNEIQGYIEALYTGVNDYYTSAKEAHQWSLTKDSSPNTPTSSQNVGMLESWYYDRCFMLNTIEKLCDNNTFNFNNQVKVVNTPGYTHMVFEDSKRIIYRRSTNQGAIWDIVLDLTKLVGLEKSDAPSITTIAGDVVLIVAHEIRSGSAEDLWLFRGAANGSIWSAKEIAYGNPSFPERLSPVIATDGNNTGLIVYQTDGLCYLYTSDAGVTWIPDKMYTLPPSSSMLIPTQGGSSVGCQISYPRKPSLAFGNTPWGGEFHLVYEAQCGTNSEVYYQHWNPNTQWSLPVQISYPIQVSGLSVPLTQHNEPAISSDNANGQYDIHAVWTATSQVSDYRIIHRHGYLVSFSSAPHTLGLQQCSKPVVSAMSSGRALCAFTVNSGNTWIAEYTGGSWQYYSTYNPGVSIHLSQGVIPLRYFTLQQNSECYSMTRSLAGFSKSGARQAVVSRAFYLYPNEVTQGNLVTVARLGGNVIDVCETYTMYDMSGRIVKVIHSENPIIDTSDMRSGMYFIRDDSGAGENVVPLIVK